MRLRLAAVMASPRSPTMIVSAMRGIVSSSASSSSVQPTKTGSPVFCWHDFEVVAFKVIPSQFDQIRATQAGAKRQPHRKSQARRSLGHKPGD